MNTYIPLLAVQQRPHRIGYDMPVRDYASGMEAAAAGAAARARLRGYLRLAAPMAPRPVPDAPLCPRAPRERLPRDILCVDVPDPVDTPLTSAHRIIRNVCQKHGFTLGELYSARRAWPLVAARHEAMYRLSKETSMSIPAIGRRLGGRDHSTVLYGVKKHAAKLQAASLNG